MSEKAVGFIENGVVVDHLPLGSVWKIAKILNAEEKNLGRVSLGDNYSSNKVGKKGFIKIEGKNLKEQEINLVALVAPEATLSFIENGQVKLKKKATIPSTISEILYCSNLNCITNDPKEKIKSKIYYSNEEFKCHYCGTVFGKNEIKIKE